jgi:uncharacterized membrane protein
MDLLNHETMETLVEVIWAIFAYIWILVMVVWGAKAVYLLIYRRFFNHSLSTWIVRIKLWHYLVLSLEFLVAKDILESIVNPTTEWLITLWAIVLIRTVLSYFLNKEIFEVKEEIKYYEEKVKAHEEAKKEKLKKAKEKITTTKSKK